MKKLPYLNFLLAMFISSQTFAQTTAALRQKIQQILLSKNATVAVAISGLDGQDTVSVNGDMHCPMQSVFKFHIGVTVLSQIDKGKLTLDQQIEIKKKDLLPKLWSPLREENPEGATLPISKILGYTVSMSDNVGCDVLLRLIGGPQSVEKFFKRNKIKDIAVKVNEEDQQGNWDLQFRNWTTAKAANQALMTFYDNSKKQLSQQSYDFFWKTMKETSTGLNRLKGQLPVGTVIAHKTGSSGTNKEGLTAALNDIGVVFLPNGEKFYISVLVTNSKENNDTNEKIIADIAKAAWDHFLAKQ